MGRLASRLLPVLALGLLLATPARAADPELVIGVLLPMSGDVATYGEESWNGVKIAEKEIRAKDPAFAFKLVLNDEQSKREQVGPQTKQLIENHGASIVLGSVASSQTMQAAIVCKEAGIPLLTHASTNDKLTDETDEVREGRLPRLLQGLLPGHHARPLRVEHPQDEEGRRPDRQGAGLQRGPRGAVREGVRPARRDRRDRVLHLHRQGLHDARPEGRRAGARGDPDLGLLPAGGAHDPPRQDGLEGHPRHRRRRARLARPAAARGRDRREDLLHDATSSRPTPTPWCRTS